MSSRLRNWFRRGELETGLDRELQYHLERRVADMMRAGTPEPEARRLAALELGGAAQIREEVSDVWLTRWLRELAADLRFAARSFRRTPVFAATAILSLALGIGATTAIYSLVNQILLQQLPVKEPDRLVLIDWNGEQLSPGRGSGNLMSYPICRDLALHDRIFDGVFCRYPTEATVSTGGDHQSLQVELVSGSFFPVLGVKPALGRLLNASDDVTPGAHPVAVVSYDFWRNQLGAAPDVVGRKVLVNKHPMAIVGVAAQGFFGVDVGEVPAVWVPTAMKAITTPGWDDLLNRRSRWMHVFGRLKPGVTVQQAQAGLQPWFKSMLEEDRGRAGFPNVNATALRSYLASTLELTPAPQGRSGLRSRLSQPLGVLFAATAVLLGLACLNVAGLILARGSARSREISARMALGASPGRVARQLLADSILLAGAGGIIGLLLAPVVIGVLITFLPGDAESVRVSGAIDGNLFGFAFLVTTLGGLLSGAVPAWQAGRVSLSSALSQRGGSGAGGGVRLRKVIVTAQIAFTLVLVIGAALFVRTLTSLMEKGPGFATTRLITFRLDPPRAGYDKASASRLMRGVYSQLKALPNAQAVAISSVKMLDGGSWNMFLTIDAHERITTDRVAHLSAVSPEFFSTLGVRLLAGRGFNDRDAAPPGEGNLHSAIVNESLARRYFGARSPLGARIAFGDAPDVKPDMEIVGVVKDFSYRGLREESEQAFFPIFEGMDGGGAHFYARLEGPQDAAFATIRRVIRENDSTLPVEELRSMDEQVNRSLTTERLLATVSGGFGALALLLSLVGLYGVMSFVVTQRTREIGVRLALGATRQDAVWLIMRDALMMIGAGALLALPCVWGLGRLVESQLFGVQPTDAATIGAATLFLAAVALGAALIPAYRASTVSPTVALRFE